MAFNNPHLVSVIDIVMRSDGQVAGYTMPYVAGRTLSFRYQYDELIVMFREMGSLFREYLHPQSIVLGDLNLSNIMIDQDDNWHIIDLDSARVGDLKQDCLAKTFVLYLGRWTKEKYSNRLIELGVDNFQLFYIFFHVFFRELLSSGKIFLDFPLPLLVEIAKKEGFTVEMIEILKMIYQGEIQFENYPYFDEVVSENFSKRLTK